MTNRTPKTEPEILEIIDHIREKLLISADIALSDEKYHLTGDFNACAYELKTLRDYIASPFTAEEIING